MSSPYPMNAFVMMHLRHNACRMNLITKLLGHPLKESTFSVSRRKIIKATAASLLLPSAAIAADNKKKHNFGILGRQAPELEVPFWIDGKGNATNFTLAEQQGKFVFMELWQYWCPGCHAHGLPDLKRISDEFKDNPHVTAVSIQTVFEGGWINTKSKLDNIQDKYELHDIVMGHETGKDQKNGLPTTMHNYRSGGTPWAVIIAPDGRVIFNDFQVNVEGVIKYFDTETAKLS